MAPIVFNEPRLTWSHRRRRFAALAIVVATVGCTHLPWRPYRGWRSYQSNEITLYANTLVEHDLALEYLRLAYDVYKGTFFQHAEVPSVEALYLPPESDTPFLTDGGVKKFGAMIRRARTPLVREHAPLLLVGRWSNGAPYAHFLAHHFIEGTIPGAPLWFHEGFARYLASFAAPADRRRGVICFGLRQPGSWDHITPPIEELLSLSWDRHNEVEALWADPMAWALIHYLLHGEGNRHRPRFRLLLNALAAGQGSEAALAEAFPDLTLDELDRGLREYIRTEKSIDLCPLPVPLAGVRAKSVLVRTDVAEDVIRAVFGGLESLPARRGHADLF